MKNSLWLLLSLLFLIPVFVVNITHHDVAGSSVNGVLVTGIESLDSILVAANGRPVLINFWATWCGPCVREMPLLDKLATDFGDEAVFVAVDLGDPELSTVESFRENNPIGITVVWLSQEDAELVSSRYQLADALPMTIVLDRLGVETVRAVGARSEEWFASALAGASGSDVEIVADELEIHIYVVGPVGNEQVNALLDEAVLIGGSEAIEFLDPTVPEDSIAMAEAYLPMSGWPYAQLCVGGACNRPVGSPEELHAAFESMR